MSRSFASAFALLAFAPSLFALPPSERPLPPREAPMAMGLPEGFKVTLFAGEPDVVQPIAFCFDDRGRLWVCESQTYPGWIKDGKPGKDRIIILEDVDNDGVHDKRTVFADGLANLTSIEYGFGGVYALCAPYLLHIPITPSTDRPAGPPKVLLDGWSLECRHNIVNGLKWGPDGWLYGCHGIVATSKVGPPGTPEDKRGVMNCGVWRFHPVKHTFEVVAHGTTNPWGIDWDEQGELYLTNCVIDHAFHVVPGGHYQRMYGQDFNPHLYKLMGSCVDHLHWAGGHWTSSRGATGKHSEAGGGHAHVGCMIYLGTSFPKEYRNSLFTCNLHGNRVNRDRIDYTAKGPVLRHEKDFLHANDPWFRGLAIDYGPDGGVYVADWCDTGECHNYEVAHKITGRIYKVTYQKPLSGKDAELPRPAKDLTKLGDVELLQQVGSDDGWRARHARRLLLERFSGRERGADEFLKFGDEVRRLHHEAIRRHEIELHVGKFGTDFQQARRFPWDVDVPERLVTQLAALDMIGAVSATDRQLYLRCRTPAARAWAVASLLESGDVLRSGTDQLLLEHLARDDTSRQVRLKIASGLQRIPPAERWTVARILASRSEDADDPMIPLLLWYAIEPLPSHDPENSVGLLLSARIPLVRELISRRLASLPGRAALDGLERLVVQTSKTASPAVHRDALRGLQAALTGRRDHAMPAAWRDAYPVFEKSSSAEVRDRSLALAVTFGDERALGALRALVKDPSAATERREQALQALVFKRPPGVRDMLEHLLDDAALRPAAIRGLGTFADEKVPATLLARYPKLSTGEKEDVVHTLTTRPAFALALLDAVAAKTVDRRDLNAFTVRQMMTLKDKRVKARVEEVWGAVRPASQEKAALLTKYRQMLDAESVKAADPHLGRRVFTQHCASCHRLFGEGGTIGPDLTGSQRANLDYVLENMIDPSGVVSREYQVVVVTTTAGRTISGILKEENEQALTMQTPNEQVIVPTAEVEERTASKLSIMPEGALDRLYAEEVRALVAYLARPEPLPK